MLGDLIIPVDSLSISLGVGSSITLKAGAVGSHSSVVRVPAAKEGGPGFDSQWLPWVFCCFFSLPVGLLMLTG